MEDETVDDDRHYSGRPVTVEEHDALAKAVAALSARVMRLEDTTTICAQDGTPLYMVQNADRTDEVHRAPAVTDAHIAFEDWTRSVSRTPTGVSILATPPNGEVRPMLIVDLPEATARWLGGRILAALDVKASSMKVKLAEEPPPEPVVRVVDGMLDIQGASGSTGLGFGDGGVRISELIRLLSAHT